MKLHTKQLTLAALTACVFAAFTSRSEANDPTDVELSATPYGGTTSGRLPARAGCAFAPSMGTTFGGLGGAARVRVHPQGDRTTGLTIAAQGAVEHQTNTLRGEGSDHQTAIPADQPMAAGSVCSQPASTCQCAPHCRPAPSPPSAPTRCRWRLRTASTG